MTGFLRSIRSVCLNLGHQNNVGFFFQELRHDVRLSSGRQGALFRRDVAKFEDVRAGSVLQGRVTNAVDFGAFVDVGVGTSGLVHVSK